MSENTRDQVVCTGHEELRDIALGTRNDVKHLNEAVQRFIAQMENHEGRIREIEIQGSKISQDNSETIREISKRVDTVEEFVDGHRAAAAETSKIAAIVAGVVSTVCTVIGVVLSIWFTGRS
jgi:hypothetical protein